MVNQERPRIWRYLNEHISTRYILVGLVMVAVALFWGLGRYISNTNQVFARVKPTPISGTAGVAFSRAVAHLNDLVDPSSIAGSVLPLSIPNLPEAAPVVALPEIAPSRVSGDAAPAAQPLEGRAPNSPAPAASFLALEDNNTRVPPNTMGAVGPSHLMVTLSSQVRIQDRIGTTLSTTSLQNFWSPVGPYTTTTGVFGPRLNYDPFGERWIAAASADPNAPSSSALVAVSQTNDPTGAWNFYRVDVDATNIGWADTPSVGFNKDWIVVEVDIYTVAVPPAPMPFIHSQIYVFDKADLYAGGAGNYTLITLPLRGSTHVPAATYDNSLATMYLVKNWSGDLGTVGIWSITGDVGSETISFIDYVSTGALWENEPAVGWHGLAPQLDDPRLIMNNDARIQNVVYRNGSLWATHTVFLPSNGGSGSTADRSAVQWWEIDPVTPSVVQFGRLDDPTGNTFYAFPSIGVNQDSDFLIGYSRFSATQYASANYAYHDHTDALNSLQADTVLKAGEAKYVKEDSDELNRWGDYSHTVVDPVNDLDFWTIQQYAALPSGGFDRWGTWWGKIIPGPMPTATPTPSNTPTQTTTPTQTNTPDPFASPTPTVTPGPPIPDISLPMIYKVFVP